MILSFCAIWKELENQLFWRQHLFRIRALLFSTKWCSVYDQVRVQYALFELICIWCVFVETWWNYKCVIYILTLAHIYWQTHFIPAADLTGIFVSCLLKRAHIFYVAWRLYVGQAAHWNRVFVWKIRLLQVKFEIETFCARRHCKQLLYLSASTTILTTVHRYKWQVLRLVFSPTPANASISITR